MSAPTIHEVAGEAYRLFERKTRDNGDDYVSLKEDAPDWLRELVQEAHCDMLPDDWRYECIQDALGAIDDAGEDAALDETEHEFADGVDVYNSTLIEWLGSNGYRQGYCDEAQAEGIAGEDASVIDLMRVGQYMERREVFGLVARALADHVETLEDESEEA